MTLIWSRRRVLGAMAIAGSGALMTRQSVQAQTGGNLLERLRSQKMAKVAIAAQPPYSELLPDGTLGGIGPAVSKAVMDKLGVPKLEGIVVPYGDMIPGLMAGRWDFVSACLSVTQARCKQVNYSPPIVFDPVTGAYIGDKNVPTSFDAIAKSGMSVGVISGAYILPKLRSMMAADKLITFPDTNALVDGVAAKRVDIGLGANSGFIVVQKAGKVDFKISKPMTDMLPAGSGPAFRQTDNELFDAFSKEVMAMKQSGEIAKLNAQYGFVYDREQYDRVTMQEACQVAI